MFVIFKIIKKINLIYDIVDKIIYNNFLIKI